MAKAPSPRIAAVYAFVPRGAQALRAAFAHLRLHKGGPPFTSWGLKRAFDEAYDKLERAAIAKRSRRVRLTDGQRGALLWACREGRAKLDEMDMGAKLMFADAVEMLHGRSPQPNAPTKGT